MAADNIHFYSQNEKVTGKFFPANGEIIKTILLLQGFPGNPDDVLGLGEELSVRGYNVFTFNYRGTFDSEGFHGLENSQQDIAAAYTFLCKDNIVERYGIDTSKLILGGYSFGGGMALTYAANNDGFARVFAIAPTDHGQFARDIQNNKEYHDTFLATFASLQKPDGPVKFERVDFAELLDNADYYDLRKAVRQLTDKDLFLIYGIDDASVTLEDHGLPFYRSLSDAGFLNLKVKIFPDDHTFGKSREELTETVSRWLVTSEKERLESRFQQVDLAKRWFEGVYGNDPSVVEELATEDVIISYPIFQKLFGQPAISGREDVAGFASGFGQRWEDTEVTFHETIVQDRKVVLIWSFKGRNVGSVSDDSEATKQIREWGGITLIQFNDEGKIEAEIGEESEPGPFGRWSTADK